MILPRRFIPGGIPPIPVWPNLDQFTHVHSYSLTSSAGETGLDIDQTDGTAFYYTRGSASGVRECTMTGWDISTVSGCLTNTAMATDLRCVRWNRDDGTSVWVTQDAGLTVNVIKYAAGTPWSLTGITSGDATTKDITSDLASPNTRGLFMRPGGLELWLTDGGTNTYRYTMSAYDPSTLVLASTYTSMPQANDLYFSPDGMRYYTAIGTSPNATIKQWNLTSAYDLSTIPGTADYTLNVSAQVGGSPGNPYGLTFRPSGTDLYMLSWPNREVHRYSA